MKSSMFDGLYKFLKLIMWPSDCQFIIFGILFKGTNCKKIPDRSQVGQLAGLNDHMLGWQLFRNDPLILLMPSLQMHKLNDLSAYVVL